MLYLPIFYPGKLRRQFKLLLLLKYGSRNNLFSEISFEWKKNGEIQMFHNANWNNDYSLGDVFLSMRDGTFSRLQDFSLVKLLGKVKGTSFIIALIRRLRYKFVCWYDNALLMRKRMCNKFPNIKSLLLSSEILAYYIALNIFHMPKTHFYWSEDSNNIRTGKLQARFCNLILFTRNALLIVLLLLDVFTSSVAIYIKKTTDFIWRQWILSLL